MELTRRIVVRGGGDLATGIVQKFHRCGLPVVILETPFPTAIRRGAVLCEAVYEGVAQVEGMVCRKISRLDDAPRCWQAKEIPLLIDPQGASIREIQPAAVIDAILARRNLGTTMDMAPVTIALGPGFTAGRDVHAVIETMRGHDLGRLIFQGCAMPNTGIPGTIAGKSTERILRAPTAGTLRCYKKIGDVAACGEAVFAVDGHEVCAPFTGLLRGLLRDSLAVTKGLKAADIDPRLSVDWRSISDKARCIGGAALEAYFYYYRAPN